MARIKPIDNPEYSKIIFAIFSGNRRPKQLLKIFKGQSKNNLSMKLQQLITLGFVSRPKRDYFVNPTGMMKYIAVNILSRDSDEKMEFYRRKYNFSASTFNSSEKIDLIINSKACHRLLFCYLFQSSKQAEPALSPNNLLKQFVMGIGFAHYQKISDATTAARMLAEKTESKNILWSTSERDWAGYVSFKNSATSTFLQAVVSPQMRIAESVMQLAEDGSIDFEKLGI